MFGIHLGRLRVTYLISIIIGLVVVAGISSTALVLSHQSDQQSPQKPVSIAPASAKISTVSTLGVAPVTSPPTTPAASTPAVTTTTKTAKTVAASTPVTNNTVQATTSTVTAPAQASVSPWSVTISADGCYVTGTGAAGLTFVAGAYIGQSGGVVTYTLPASGILTVSAGGFEGYTSYGYVENSSATILASATGSITQTACPIPSE